LGETKERISFGILGLFFTQQEAGLSCNPGSTAIHHERHQPHEIKPEILGETKERDLVNGKERVYPNIGNSLFSAAMEPCCLDVQTAKGMA
jgi:hypothetical protein